MAGKEFLHSLANGQSDIVEILLDIIAKRASPYCVIGGLASTAVATAEVVCRNPVEEVEAGLSG
jgi:hypothetical protein